VVVLEGAAARKARARKSTASGSHPAPAHTSPGLQLLRAKTTPAVLQLVTEEERETGAQRHGAAICERV